MLFKEELLENMTIEYQNTMQIQQQMMKYIEE